MHPFLKWLDEHSIGIFYTFFFFPVIYALFVGMLVLLENFFNIPFLPEIINCLIIFIPNNMQKYVLYYGLYYLLYFLFAYLISHIIYLHKENLKIKKKSLSTSADFDLLRLSVDKKKEIFKKIETEQDANNLTMLKVLLEHLESNIENIIKSGGRHKFTSNNFFEYRWNQEENKYTKFDVGWKFIYNEAKKEIDEECSRTLSHHEYLCEFYHKNCLDGFIPQPIEENMWNFDLDDEEYFKQLNFQEIFDLHLSDKEMKYFFDESLVGEDLLKIYRDVYFLSEARRVKENITGYSVDSFYVYNDTYTLLEEMKKAVIRENNIT